MLPDFADPPESLAERAYRGIRARIREGRLAPGERVTEMALADALDMSRTPVREAMRRLQAEGLIVAAPPRGLALACPNPAEIEEIFTMRLALEGAAAQLAAENATPDDVAALRRMCDEDASLPPNDAQALAAANRRFHAHIAVAARNRHLLRALCTFSDSLLLLGPTPLSVPGRPGAALAEHRAVVRAIAARDPDAAGAAMRQHLTRAQQARVAGRLWELRAQP